MDIVAEPNIYKPGVNFSGNYIDNVPNFKYNTYGIICPCSNKDKVFRNRQSFTGHTKTKKHLSWLETINNNRSNYLVDNVGLKETIKNQKIIIANFEKEIRSLNKKINEMNVRHHDPGIDLLGIDE
jgi:hypothetical protein